MEDTTQGKSSQQAIG